ncbi:MAG: hypothetical protein HYZ27_12590 [Deltaproteobacteria bacterium]|nr:hypothetical protein [Deltaproteobacteria bacterium]
MRRRRSVQAKTTPKRSRRVTGTRSKRRSGGHASPTRPQNRPLPPPAAANSDVQGSDNPGLDRRIIEGMLKDRRRLFDDLAKEGYSPNMILRRAADLGLSEAFIRQVQGVAADLAGERPGGRKTPTALGARTCLSCDRVFLSSGPGNRLCMRCRGGDAGLAQL